MTFHSPLHGPMIIWDRCPQSISYWPPKLRCFDNCMTDRHETGRPRRSADSFACLHSWQLGTVRYPTILSGKQRTSRSVTKKSPVSLCFSGSWPKRHFSLIRLSPKSWKRETLGSEITPCKTSQLLLNSCAEWKARYLQNTEHINRMPLKSNRLAAVWAQGDGVEQVPRFSYCRAHAQVKTSSKRQSTCKTREGCSLTLETSPLPSCQGG